MKRLNEISDIIMGQSPASSTYNTIGEGVPFFQGNADFGIEHPNVRVYCSLPTKMSEKGDVLISVRAPIGAVNLANQRCCIGRGLAAVRPLEGKSQTRYLYHLLIANREALESKGTGSTFKAITGKVLNDVHVPSYNMEQQKEIARVLDTVVTAIRKRQKQIAFYNDLVKSQFIEMFGPVGTDEKGWGLIALGDCCELNPKKSDDSRLKEGLEVSFVPMSAVSEKGGLDNSDIRSYEQVQKGFTYFAENDVLFAKITPCMENGKGAVARGLKNGVGFGSTEFHILRPKAGVCNPVWLYIFMSFKQFRQDAARKMTGSAGQRRVPSSFLSRYKVSLPPIVLQNQFATFVEQTDKSKNGSEMEVAA